MLEFRHVVQLGGLLQDRQGKTEAGALPQAVRFDPDVVAEGIETPQQRALRESAGCDFGQGCFFARPVGVDEFEELLARLSIAS